MTLDELIARLEPTLAANPQVRFAVLFGSAVVRGPDRARDIDLAVCFRGSPSLMERGAMTAELEAQVGRDVDLIDLAEASTLLRWETVRIGVVVAASDPDAWADFRAYVPIEYADLRPYFDRESEGQRHALLEHGWSE